VEYISAILDHVVPIVSEASRSELGLFSLVALIALAIALLFLYLTAHARPVLSFVLALVTILLMFGGVVGLVLSVDVRKPAVVYDVNMLQRLQNVGFKIPDLEDKNSTDYQLLDGMLHLECPIVPAPAGDKRCLQTRIILYLRSGQNLFGVGRPDDAEFSLPVHRSLCDSVRMGRDLK
jgi:hypothetical protein